MIRHSNLRITGIFFASAVVLAGCSSAKGAGAGQAISPTGGATTNSTPTPSAAESTSNMFSASSIEQALKAISVKVGTPRMKLLKMDLVDTSMTVQAINPAKPSEVNQFEYTDGGVQAPRPVDVSESEPGALEQNLYNSTLIKPISLAKLIAEAAPLSKVDGGRVGSVDISRTFSLTGDVMIIINVSGTRAHKQIKATAGYKIISVN